MLISVLLSRMLSLKVAWEKKKDGGFRLNIRNGLGILLVGLFMQDSKIFFMQNRCLHQRQQDRNKDIHDPYHVVIACTFGGYHYLRKGIACVFQLDKVGD